MRRRAAAPLRADPTPATRGPAAPRGPARGALGAVAALAETARRIGNGALERLLGAGARRGAPLERGVADAASTALGGDVSDVRVVDDAESHAAARALDAVAFTAGGTIFVGEEAPPRSSAAGRALLAHELAHVLQQREASASLAPGVSAPGDAHERAAERASRSLSRGEPAPVSATATVTAAAPAAVQRQPTAGAAKKDGLSRAEARRILEGFFQRTLAAQGTANVRMTEDVKNTIRRIFLNDVAGLMRLDAFLGGSVFPGTPAELAAAVAKYLPDPIDPSRLAHLGAPSGPPPSTFARVGDVVQKTAPYESPQAQEQKWAFEREAKQLRTGEGAIGPYGVDVLRLYNVGKALPGALKPPSTPPPEAASYPEVEAVVATLSPTMLTPAAARGTASAGDYADAQLVARDVARRLDLAHRQRVDSVALHLGANYDGVKDRAEIVAQVAKLVRLVRDALPHQAGGVSTVDLYFGDKLVRRISLAATPE